MAASFMTYVTLVMALIAAIPVINCTLKLRSEERKHRLDSVYALAVSKAGMFATYIVISLCLSLLLQLAQSFGLWLMANTVMAEPFALWDVLAAGLGLLPGMWLFTGIGVLLTGLLPRLTAIVWAYFGLSFFAVYIGRMMDLPAFVAKLSAFGALPSYPVDAFAVAPFMAVTAVAMVLIGIGLVAYARREVRYD
jgi:ABC-2 type transport system permease protein